MSVLHVSIGEYSGSSYFRRISDLKDDCILQKIAYAHRHGYVEYMDQIAPLSFPKSMKDALKAFGPGLLYIAWVRIRPASRDQGLSRLTPFFE